MDNRVSIRRCSNYEDQEVERAVNAGLSDIGGIDRYIKPGMKVLLKCNLLMKKSPEESATTHPRVAVAVARAVRKAGAVPIVADSPGGPYTRHMLSIIYKGCGFEDIAQKEDIQLNYNTEVAEVKNPHGRIIKN